MKAKAVLRLLRTGEVYPHRAVIRVNLTPAEQARWMPELLRMVATLAWLKDVDAPHARGAPTTRVEFLVKVRPLTKGEGGDWRAARSLARIYPPNHREPKWAMGR